MLCLKIRKFPFFNKVPEAKKKKKKKKRDTNLVERSLPFVSNDTSIYMFIQGHKQNQRFVRAKLTTLSFGFPGYNVELSRTKLLWPYPLPFKCICITYLLNGTAHTVDV